MKYIKLYIIIAVFYGLSNAAIGSEDHSDTGTVGRDILIQKAQQYDIDAICSLGLSGDKVVIPALSKMLEEARRSDVGYRYIDSIRIALARLGDAQVRKEIINDFDSAGHMRQRAFKIASEIKGNDMIIAIAGKLDDPRPGERDLDVGYAAPRHLAVIALSQIITDPSAPKIDLGRITYDEENVQRWKIWWANNKERYMVHQ